VTVDDKMYPISRKRCSQKVSQDLKAGDVHEVITLPASDCVTGRNAFHAEWLKSLQYFTGKWLN